MWEDDVSQADSLSQEPMALELLRKGFALGELRRPDEAIAAYDELVARFGGAAALALREQVAAALFNKGIEFGEQGRYEEAFAAYDDLVDRFGASPELPLREQVAKTLLQKIITLSVLRRYKDEVVLCDDLVARFGTAPELPLRELVAGALFSKGLALGSLDHRIDAISFWDEFVARFGASTELPLRQKVANALLMKAVSLEKLKRYDETIATYDNLVERLSGAAELPLRQWAISVLHLKRKTLEHLNRTEEMVAVYDDLVFRFGAAPELPLRESVAEALIGKAITLEELRRYDAALAACNDLVARFADASEPSLRQMVGSARALRKELKNTQAKKGWRKQTASLEHLGHVHFRNLRQGAEKAKDSSIAKGDQRYYSNIIPLRPFGRIDPKLFTLGSRGRDQNQKGNTGEQTEGRLANAKDFVSLEEGLKGLETFFRALNVPEEKASDEAILAEVVAVAAKALADGRPRWNDRAHYEALRQLKNAPLFLQNVYRDLIESELRLPDGRPVWHLLLADGRPVWQEAVRSNDSKIVQVVQAYYNERGKSEKGLADAKTVIFAKTDTRGRPKKKAQVKASIKSRGPR